jgi:hypothetical protein
LCHFLFFKQGIALSLEFKKSYIRKASEYDLCFAFTYLCGAET